MPPGFVGDTNGVNRALGGRTGGCKKKEKKWRSRRLYSKSALYLFLNHAEPSFPKRSDAPCWTQARGSKTLFSSIEPLLIAQHANLQEKATI